MDLGVRSSERRGARGMCFKESRTTRWISHRESPVADACSQDKELLKDIARIGKTCESKWVIKEVFAHCPCSKDESSSVAACRHSRRHKCCHKKCRIQECSSKQPPANWSNLEGTVPATVRCPGFTTAYSRERDCWKTDPDFANRARARFAVPNVES